MFVTNIRRIACRLKLSPSLHLPVQFRFNSHVSSQPEAFLEPFQTLPGVKCLSLNRPQSKNAISMRLLEELTSCLEIAQYDPDLRVLILRSTTTGAFCAGADLVERRTMSQARVSKFLADLRTALSNLENLSVPTIAAIDGPALGGGLELALACDLRVAANGVSKIGLPETRLGIIPGAGGTQRAARLLGVSKAKDLIFTGRMLTAHDAHTLGLVDYISQPHESAFDRAVQLAEEMTPNAPLALKAAKLAISRAPELSLESGLDFERACYQPLLTTKDRDEALLAFKEKRPPVFKGE
ncbi:ClpP/crotonase [Rickenella mellea]|uniref:ClpP/crotonase n=1 Tax=Rickenella mellea TaxID=50990 RepID=A0A4R5XF48_9AGAM|nr:ClpP/crotonase [Rickenella mellea]